MVRSFANDGMFVGLVDGSLLWQYGGRAVCWVILGPVTMKDGCKGYGGKGLGALVCGGCGVVLGLRLVGGLGDGGKVLGFGGVG